MSWPDIVMVFVGESGSGKSTCINYFANYFTNSDFTAKEKYDGMKIVIPNKIKSEVNLNCADRPHSEANIRNVAQSQTQQCITYHFQWENQSIHVVDTPGFNDSDMNNDAANITKILTKMSELPFVTAILVTINGTTSRLQTGLKSALAQLESSLPDAVFKNLFFIYTNCTEETRNFPESLLADFQPKEEHTFHMQNSLFSIQDMSVLNNDRSLRRMVNSWEESVETMGKIIEKICRLTAASVKDFEEMRIKRESLVSQIEILISIQKSLINTVKTIEIEKKRLENANNNKEHNQDFIGKSTIEVIEIETKPYFSLLCVGHGDVSVCHENCSLDFSAKLNLDHFKRCAAADGNNCRHCKCGMNRHFHSYEIPVSKKKDVDQIIQAKHTAYLIASSEANKIQNEIRRLDLICQQFRIEINTISNQILATMKELKQICTRFNFVKEMSGTIEKLRNEPKSVNNLLAKEAFEATVNTIAQFVQQLN